MDVKGFQELSKSPTFLESEFVVEIPRRLILPVLLLPCLCLTITIYYQGNYGATLCIYLWGF